MTWNVNLAKYWLSDYLILILLCVEKSREKSICAKKVYNSIKRKCNCKIVSASVDYSKKYNHRMANNILNNEKFSSIIFSILI